MQQIGAHLPSMAIRGNRGGARFAGAVGPAADRPDQDADANFSGDGIAPGT
jgi:hypothetical protein